MIEDLMVNHYPERLNKIYVVKIAQQNITLKVKQRFEQRLLKRRALLFDDNFQNTLPSRFFDPSQLLKAYGG